MKNVRTFESFINENLNEAKEKSYEIMRLVNGRTKELIEGTIEEIMSQFSSAIDKLRDSGSGNLYKKDPETIEELVSYLNAAQSFAEKNQKPTNTFQIHESVVNELHGHKMSGQEIQDLTQAIVDSLTSSKVLTTNKNDDKKAYNAVMITLDRFINESSEIVEDELNENRRSNYDNIDGPVVTDIKDALKIGKVNVGSMVDVSVDSNNRNLPDNEYAIMPMTDMGDYWKVGDLKRFADKVIDDLKEKLKGKYTVELVKVDTGRSIRSYIVKVTK